MLVGMKPVGVVVGLTSTGRVLDQMHDFLDISFQVVVFRVPLLNQIPYILK